MKLESTQLLVDFSRESATLGVRDIDSYEDFAEIEKRYERWQEK